MIGQWKHRISCGMVCAMLAGAAQAHPHIFVQARVTIAFDDTGLAGIHLDWTYDDLFSLLLTTDLDIDADGDLVLTPDETAQMVAAVSDWPADYDGDLEVTQNDAILPLGPRRDVAVTYVDGRVTESHMRPLAAQPDLTAPLSVRVYDPYYYVAYDLDPDITITGRTDCTATIQPANVDAASAQVAALLDGRDAADVGPEEDFPAVGRAFADTIVVTCAD